MYCVDTNIYLDFWERRYPSDLFPSYAAKIEALIAAQKWFAPMRVKNEIDHVGSPALKMWAARNMAQFVRDDKPLLDGAKQVLQACPNLLDPDAMHEEADAYVIALARARGAVVVTHETPARRKGPSVGSREYIPDVCPKVGVTCLDLLHLMRREKWKFQ